MNAAMQITKTGGDAATVIARTEETGATVGLNKATLTSGDVTSAIGALANS